MTEALEMLRSLSPAKQALYLLERLQSKVEETEVASSEPIAVVGLACRLPGGANDAEGFWALLRDGGDAISEVPPDRWETDQLFDPDPDQPGKLTSKWGGFLDKIDHFDAAFFGISRREANAMDPQQRLLLEVAWEALESAGLAAHRLRGSATGVFFGMTTNDYVQHLGRLPIAQADAYMPTGNAFSVAAGRLSHLLGFEGPSLTLDTACSSSLVAVHLAGRSLRQRECRLALAGGVNLILCPHTTVSLSKARILAADGRCKSFDAAADGYVRGEGCGVVVLKRLSDARADGDRILALIRGSAIMHDGSSSGLTVPSGTTQEKLLRQSYSDAGIEPQAVTYVEAHGSGTALGDPIEMSALSSVFGAKGENALPLFVGSVKTNLGHLEAAAGIAALIKTILAMQNRKIPPHLHFRTLNPEICLEGLRIRIPTALTEWPATQGPRIAGVSSFGFSGTNAHLVLEEAPPDTSRAAPSMVSAYLVPLSAKSEIGLADLSARYRYHLEASPEQSLRDIALTAADGRCHFDHRFAVLASSRTILEDALDARHRGDKTERVFCREAPVDASVPKVAFLFAGQGVQFVEMGRGLFDASPHFRETLERCDEILQPLLELSLIEMLYGNAPREKRERLLDRSRFTQPALFAVQFALASLWQSWGIEPAMLLGQSLGEYTAACVAGVMSLEDGLALVVARGGLTEAVPQKGAMAAVHASEQQVAEILAEAAPDVSIAAINSPEGVVIAGMAEAVDRALQAFSRAGIESRKLRVSYASHCPLMDPVLEAFEREANRFSYAVPRLGLVSNVTGEMAQQQDATYWRRHLRAPVRFADGIRTLAAAGCNHFLEVGPGASGLVLGRQCLSSGHWLPSLKDGRDDWEQMLESLAQLYVNGAEVNWPGVYRPAAGYKCRLPTYPFQRQRYWIDDEGDAVAPAVSRTPQHRIESDKEGIDSLLFEVTWQREDPPPRLENGADAGVWVLCAQNNNLRAELARTLELRGDRVVCVALDNGSSAQQAGSQEVPPHDWRAMQEVLALARQYGSIKGVVHLWGLAGATLEELDERALERAQELACGGALTLVKALTLDRPDACPPLWLVSRGAQSVGEVPTSVAPQQMPLLSLGRVIAAEHPELRCRRLDVDPASIEGEAVEQLVAELSAPGDEDQIAYRQGRRYLARLARVDRSATGEETAGPEGVVRKDGSYLIAGGLGGLGLRLTRWLKDKGATSLALLTRSAPNAEGRAAMARLRSAGIKVTHLTCDLSMQSDVEAAITVIEAELPPLRGVIHAAGVVHDGALQQLEWETFTSVTASKLLGAWHLHRATAHQELDWFLCCSSAAAVLGPPGQGSYAAANAFMDALMHHRRAEGLPALSINWGPWADVGMASRIPEQHRARLQAHGIDFMAPDRALQALDWALESGRAQITVCGFNPKALESLTGFHAPPFLSRFVGAGPSVAADATVSLLLESLAETSGAGRRAILRAYTKFLVARLLQAETAEIQTDRHLIEYGLDSIMIMTLAQQLEAGLDLPVPTNEIFKRTTIREIAGYLDGKLPPGDADREPATAAPLDGTGSKANARHRAAASFDKGQGEDEEVAAELTHRPHDRPSPLSFGQRGLWLFQQLRPESAVYNIRHAIRFDGPLDLTVLERSLNDIVRRHEVLRSSFASEGGQPHLSIKPFLYLPLERIDLTGLPRDHRQQEAERLAAEITGRPFDLANAPLLRALCLRLEADLHLLLLPMHHMVSDGWSLGVILRELAALYQAFSCNAASPLPALPLQYADFAAWQHRNLQGARGAELMAYWRDHLASAPLTLELPGDQSRPALQSHRAARLPLVLNADLTQQLVEVSRSQGVTLFVTLLAAFKLLLSRLSGQSDIVVGSPVAIRHRAGLRDLIGFFVNILPLRTKLAELQSVSELLQQVGATALGGLAHQDLPFDRLVEDVAVERDLSRSPLVQVLFNFVEIESRSLAFSGLQATGLPAAEPETKFDLTLYVRRLEQAVAFDLVWNADLFSRERVAAWLDHYHALLQAIAADPDALIAELPSGTKTGSRERPGFSPSGGAVEATEDVTVVAAFERQAQVCPDRLALRACGRALTYDALNGEANQVARFLISQGLQKGARVALLFNQGTSVIAAIFGVLKAGGVYLPIPQQLPQERISTLMEVGKAEIALTDSANYARLPVLKDGDRGTIAVFDVATIDSNLPRDNLASRVAADDLAYILFTSGSTGEPKGVMQTHANVLHHSRCYAEGLDIGPTDHVSLLASYAFDAAVMDIFGALLHGASLHLLDLRSDFAALPSWLDAEEITVLHLTPTALSQLARGLSAAQRLVSVRALVLGGEEASRSHFEIFRRNFSPTCVLVNGLGPSESTLALQMVLSHDTELEGQSLPVGFPVGDAQILLLDEAGRPTACFGEIAIRSAHLAPGYWQRADLTAEAFEIAADGTRLYRSGDLGRRRPDGAIEFAGRRDRQVKIRGFKVVLGEVEAVLRAHPGVADGRVVATETGGERSLMACVVPEGVLDVKDLQSFLRQRLPAYMIPGRSVFTDTLPMKENGKLDLEALLALEPEMPARHLRAPESDRERRMLEIWEKVLVRTGVSTDDDFFALGGHSLKVLQLLAGISDTFGVELSIETLFQHPTVAELTRAVEATTESQAQGAAAGPNAEGGTIAAIASDFFSSAPALQRSCEPSALPATVALDAAALGLLPEHLLRQAGLDPVAVIDGWAEPRPRLVKLIETPWGRIGQFVLPRINSSAYGQPETLVDLVLQGLESAAACGAQSVSLTGLLGSATDYGRSVVGAPGWHGKLPSLTTGHATTTASVILSLQHLLAESGRELSRERVGFLGVGSIGRASLLLMLRCLPQPAELLLCDLYDNEAVLQELADDLRQETGYRGPLRLLPTRGRPPAAFYEASTILCATNVGNVLDVDRLAPGSLIVDDSAPLCLPADRAIGRLRDRGDILAIGGGVLRAPVPLRHRPQLPRQPGDPDFSALTDSGPSQRIGACVLSGLLSARFETMAPDLGTACAKAAKRHLDLLQGLGLGAGNLRLGNHPIDQETVARFRQRFGEMTTAARNTRENHHGTVPDFNP
ncbi:MAG: amino acid adenylation domain-containing protein [Hyphomicrobiales bacterium]|nr:amino acid adenylation domain-containing protein [Hyphomicrobiales bacterium]